MGKPKKRRQGTHYWIVRIDAALEQKIQDVIERSRATNGIAPTRKQVVEMALGKL